jgi:hypothetical protein
MLAEREQVRNTPPIWDFGNPDLLGVDERETEI